MGNIRFWPGARSPIVFLPAQRPEFLLHHPLGFLHVGLLPLRPVVAGTDWLDCRRQQLLAEGLRTEHSVAVNAFIVGSRLLRPPPFQQQVKPGPSRLPDRTAVFAPEGIRREGRSKAAEGKTDSSSSATTDG